MVTRKDGSLQNVNHGTTGVRITQEEGPQEQNRLNQEDGTMTISSDIDVEEELDDEELTESDFDIDDEEEAEDNA